MVARRQFLKNLIAFGGISGAGLRDQRFAPPLTHNLFKPQDSGAADVQRNASLIDRAALVSRHNPVITRIDPLSPLSIGNGEFAYTADVTGLQTFPQEYQNGMPLCTMSQWGWHTAPLPRGLDPKALRLVEYDTRGRMVGYQTSAEGQQELYTWLRENPHRLHLGRIGLRLITSRKVEARPSDIHDIKQTLDLWSGNLKSSFKLEEHPVNVRSAIHPRLDLLAVQVESQLIAEGRLGIRIGFPYGSPAMQAADWERVADHETRIVRQTVNNLRLHRIIDSDEYFVIINWQGQFSVSSEHPHTLLLQPARTSSSRLEFSVAFSPQDLYEPLPAVAATFSLSNVHWERFWVEGGAVELAHSRDPRAPELERRVVLSQYLTAIQCAGSKPPQETGLTVNSWYGKFHLEMHWWHAAQFALWNRLPMLEESLGWYQRILPVARDLAKSQGYAGVRWPKMVGPEGRDSPSPIGPLLIWQQPHPIFYAELCYQVHSDRKTLERYREIVFQSAEFMVSFAFFDQQKRRYVLGPPVIPAQENHPPRETWNPTLELAYWSHGLKLAQLWRERLGMKRSSEWDRVIMNLSRLPVRNGVYLAHENCPETYEKRNYDHPSMLGALGFLPGTGVDRETMRRTLKKVMKDWRWDQTWGWDYPLTAMTAARLGEPKIAIEALLMPVEKNRYLPNGHNWQRANLPCYLPGNGGLLYAVAMMAAGWKGAPIREAPGFPTDGSWTIKSETLNTLLLRQL